MRHDDFFEGGHSSNSFSSSSSASSSSSSSSSAAASGSDSSPSFGLSMVEQCSRDLFENPRFASVLGYLRATRGLQDAVLREYRVGAMARAFPRLASEAAAGGSAGSDAHDHMGPRTAGSAVGLHGFSGTEMHDCVVFPWVVPRARSSAQPVRSTSAFDPMQSPAGSPFSQFFTDAGGAEPGQAGGPLPTHTHSDGRPVHPFVLDFLDPRQALPTALSLDEQSHSSPRAKIRSIQSKAKQMMAPRGGGWGMFGLHLVPDGARHILLTEGEYDAMAVRQATGIPAVSLPNGCRSFPVELVPILERFEKIYLWMDDDLPGREGAEKISSKLGVGRCQIVRPTAPFLLPTAAERAATQTPAATPQGPALASLNASPKDANEALIRGLDLLPIVSSAAPRPHDQILSFGDLRGAVMREVAANLGVLDDGAQGSGNRPPCGWPIRCLPRLGSVVRGHRPGELTIVTGPTGCGKTTLLTQLSLDLAAQGVRTLWGSFEIKTTRLIASMLTQLRSGRIQLDSAAAAAMGIVSVADESLLAADGASGTVGGGTALSVSPSAPMTPAMEALLEYERAADVLGQLPIQFLRFYGSTDLDRVLDALEYSAYAHDIDHVILDNLQFMMSAATAGRGFDKFDMQEKAIERFRTFATKHDVHVTLVIHPRKEADDTLLSLSSVFGSAKATQEADTVMILQRDARTGRKLVDVKKNRYDGTLGSIPLLFHKEARCFYEDDGVGGVGVGYILNTPPGGVGASSGSSGPGMNGSGGGNGSGSSFAAQRFRAEAMRRPVPVSSVVRVDSTAQIGAPTIGARPVSAAPAMEAESSFLFPGAPSGPLGMGVDAPDLEEPVAKPKVAVPTVLESKPTKPIQAAAATAAAATVAVKAAAGAKSVFDFSFLNAPQLVSQK
jgi:twinkle protein